MLPVIERFRRGSTRMSTGGGGRSPQADVMSSDDEAPPEEEDGGEEEDELEVCMPMLVVASWPSITRSGSKVSLVCTYAGRAGPW